MVFDITKYLAESKVTSYSRLNESEDYIDSVAKIVFGTRLHTWKVGGSMSGAWEWESPTYKNTIIYATPGWEGQPGISIALGSPNGEEETFSPIQFKLTGTPKMDAGAYLRNMAHFIRSHRRMLERFDKENSDEG